MEQVVEEEMVEKNGEKIAILICQIQKE